jgi:hypothetical protein
MGGQHTAKPVGCADKQLRQSREITFTGSDQAAASISAS